MQPLVLVRLDGQMAVSALSEAAEAAGLRVGDQLTPLEGECEIRRHEACFARAENTRYNPLGRPQNAATFQIRNERGFGVLYVAYAYTLAECRACGALFADRRAYLDAEEDGRLAALAEERLWPSAAPAPAPGGAVAVTRTLADAAAAAVWRTRRSARADEAWEIGALLRLFLRRQETRDAMPDCALCLRLPPQPLFSRADPEGVLLVVGLILRALGDVSAERQILLSLEPTASVCRLTLETSAPALARLLISTTDLHALAAPARSGAPGLSLAEIIADECGCSIRITGDGRRLRVCCTLPAVCPDDLFYSPFDAEARLRAAVDGALSLLELLDREEQQ